MQPTSPIAVAKALFPEIDPQDLLTTIIEENDGYIGGTIRYGSQAGSEFGSEYVENGVRRSTDGPKEKFAFGDMTFDVDAAKEICGGVPNEEIQVDPSWSYKINVDKVAALNSKSTNPVLIAQIPTENGLKPLLIDGHHRLYKAIQEGRDKLPAYVLSPEESLFIMDTHPDLMTMLTQNLRDHTDDPKGGVVGDLIRAWGSFFKKSQPGSSEVHVPAPMGGKKKKADPSTDDTSETSDTGP